MSKVLIHSTPTQAVPAGWSVVQLKDILTRVAKPVVVDPSAEYREIGIRSHGKGVFHKPPIKAGALGDKRVFHVVPNALVLNIVFAWEQAVAVTSDQEVGMIASHRFPMYVPKGNLCDVDYLRYFFCTPRGKELLELASPGGAGRNKTLGQSEFEKLRIAMPPAAEQQRLREVFQTWDRAIVATEKRLANSSLQKKAVIELFVSGKNRFHENFGMWKKTTIGEIAAVLVSNVDKKTLSNERRILLCNYTDVYYNDRITANMKFMEATATEAQIEKFSLRRGDVVITKDSESVNDIGVAAYVHDEIDELVCGYHLAVIRPDLSQVNPVFLQAVFNLTASRNYFASTSNGVTRFGLPIGAIREMPICIPSIEEQNKIAAMLSTCTDDIRYLTQDLAALKSQKKELLSKLLSGRRRIKVANAETAARV
jgi:type I restriction enzyme S subunit